MEKHAEAILKKVAFKHDLRQRERVLQKAVEAAEENFKSFVENAQFMMDTWTFISTEAGRSPAWYGVLRYFVLTYL